MDKVNITLDVSKISKSKIFDRTYTNKEGQTITVKDYKMELVPLKESKVVTEGDTWVMKKTHFVVEGQSKEEKANKVKSKYIGEGFIFESKEKSESNEVEQSDDIDSEDIPF